MNSVNGRCGYGPSFGNITVRLNGDNALRKDHPVTYLNCGDYLRDTMDKLNENPAVKKRELFIGSPEEGNDIVVFERKGETSKEVCRVNPGAEGEATPNTVTHAIDTLAGDLLDIVG